MFWLSDLDLSKVGLRCSKPDAVGCCAHLHSKGKVKDYNLLGAAFCISLEDSGLRGAVEYSVAPVNTYSSTEAGTPSAPAVRAAPAPAPVMPLPDVSKSARAKTVEPSEPLSCSWPARLSVLTSLLTFFSEMPRDARRRAGQDVSSSSESMDDDDQGGGPSQGAPEETLYAFGSWICFSSASRSTGPPRKTARPLTRKGVSALDTAGPPEAHRPLTPPRFPCTHVAARRKKRRADGRLPQRAGNGGVRCPGQVRPEGSALPDVWGVEPFV